MVTIFVCFVVCSNTLGKKTGEIQEVEIKNINTAKNLLQNNFHQPTVLQIEVFFLSTNLKISELNNEQCA